MSTVPRFTHMQSLLDEILDIQSNSCRDSGAVHRIGEIIQESNEIVRGSKVPGEVVLDARILQAGSQIVNSNITTMDTNLSDFNEEEYIAGIKRVMEQDMECDDDDEEEDDTFGNKWNCFSPMMYHLYLKSEPFIFTIGSLSFDPPPPKAKPKTTRVYKRMNQAKTQLSQASESDQRFEAPEDNVCEHILRSIAKNIKLNRKKPLEFFKFVVNPGSYWETIKNIFYVSFLVRDGRVTLSHNSRGLPVILPLTPKDPTADGQAPKKKMNHFSVTMDVKEWKACVEKFKITTPMIRPLKKLKY